MVPGVENFAGGQGNTFGGAAGPATATGGAVSFGNIVSGGSGGFNPFANSGTAQSVSQLLQPQNLAMITIAVVGIVFLFKKK